jgi:hypothetical protein
MEVEIVDPVPDLVTDDLPFVSQKKAGHSRFRLTAPPRATTIKKASCLATPIAAIAYDQNR